MYDPYLSNKSTLISWVWIFSTILLFHEIYKTKLWQWKIGINGFRKYRCTNISIVYYYYCIFLKYLIQRCNKVKNSERVLEFSLNSPNIQDVTVLLVVFCTPLMTMHMWVASTTTPTPAGSTAFWTAFAISLVNLSWT